MALPEAPISTKTFAQPAPVTPFEEREFIEDFGFGQIITNDRLLRAERGFIRGYPHPVLIYREGEELRTVMIS
jgi:hypothetical protein